MITLKITIEEGEGGVHVLAFGCHNGEGATKTEIQIAEAIKYGAERALEIFTQVSGTVDAGPTVNPNN